jgi:polysaccharide pyruvyl transferase CsaB
LPQVGIAGSFGGMNLGDEAILESMIAQLRAELEVGITVFSRNAEDTRGRYQVERVVPLEELTRDELVPILDELDLFILGGGGILFDAWVKRFLREAQLAQERGVPVMTYAVGAGPLEEPESREAVRRLLNDAAAVTVRDVGARRLLEKLGVAREIVVSADPAFLLEPQDLAGKPLRREGVSGRRHIVGMSVREAGPAAPEMDLDLYHDMLANAADFIVERFEAEVVFVPMEPAVRDLQESHTVVSRMHHSRLATILRGDYSPGQVLSLVGCCDFVVGMRMHFLLFASLQSVPLVALPYAPKVRGLLHALGLEAPPEENFTVGQLLAYLDRSWDRRDRVRETIDRATPRLREDARKANEQAVRLLRG